jgi:hypothetical protein
MRRSEFDERMRERFGTYAESLLHDLVLPGLGRTGAAALEAGEDPRTVWRAVCDSKELADTDRP